MIRRKDSEDAREFWALADQAAQEVDTWPEWKRMSMMSPPVTWTRSTTSTSPPISDGATTRLLAGQKEQ